MWLNLSAHDNFFVQDNYRSWILKNIWTWKSLQSPAAQKHKHKQCTDLAPVFDFSLKTSQNFKVVTSTCSDSVQFVTCSDHKISDGEMYTEVETWNSTKEEIRWNKINQQYFE